MPLDVLRRSSQPRETLHGATLERPSSTASPQEKYYKQGGAKQKNFEKLPQLV